MPNFHALGCLSAVLDILERHSLRLTPLDHDHESEGSVSLRSRKRLTLNGLPVQRGLYRFEKLEPIQYLACIRGHRRRKILVVNIE